MFPLYFCLIVILDVSYFLIETLISIIRGRRDEADDVSEKALQRMIKKLIRRLRQENVSIKTTNRIVRRLMRQIRRRRRRNTRHRHRNLAQSHPTETNTNKDLITDDNVLVSDPDLPNTNTDLCLNLTTDSRNTEVNNDLNTLPFGLPCCQDDVTAATHVAHLFHTMCAAVNTCLHHQRSFDYPRRYRNHGLNTGMEVVLYQPEHFHGLTLDLTLACDVARMYNSISAGPIHFNYQRLTNINIPTELVAGIDKDVKIIADETVDGDKSRERTISLSCQQQTDVPELTSVLQRKENDQCSPAFLYDEDFTGPKIYAPSRELIKWEEPNDVTDCGLDLHQGEGWEATEMLATNEANFGYRTTFDEAMHDYTTVLVKDNSPEWRQRWERACRLAEEIEDTKRAERENQAKLPKKRKRKQRRTKIAQND